MKMRGMDGECFAHKNVYISQKSSEKCMFVQDWGVERHLLEHLEILKKPKDVSVPYLAQLFTTIILGLFIEISLKL